MKSRKTELILMPDKNGNMILKCTLCPTATDSEINKTPTDTIWGVILMGFSWFSVWCDYRLESIIRDTIIVC